MTEFSEFMQALRDSANARDLMGTSQPASEEEAVGIYVAAAKELGFGLSAEEIVEGMRALAQERFARTEQAEAVVSDLSVDELDAVAGGGDDDGCKYSFKHYENCWFNDACDHSYEDYASYLCKRTSAGEGHNEDPFCVAIIIK